jgi:hypothetical protein
MAQVPSSENTAVRSELDRDARWLLIGRILSSTSFRKAGRLQDLLRYIAELSILGQAAELTEQRIGEAVFGKVSGYSRVEDSSVRVHIRQLRLKLHEYFDSEGREEPLTVEIPKGSYALTFREPTAALPVVPKPEIPKPASAGLPVRAIALWVLFLALTAVSAFLWMKGRAPAASTLTWPLTAVFDSSRPTQIVLADATYAMRRLVSHQPVSLEDYIRRDFRNSLPVSGNEEDSWLSSYTAGALLTSYADVAVTTAILKLLPGHMERVSVRSARDLNMRDLEEGNYILLGSPASNPWVLLYENRLNFQEVRGDETKGVVKYFKNRKPQTGEQPTYAGLSRTGVNGDDYGDRLATGG